jgi:hypothetical protein
MSVTWVSDSLAPREAGELNEVAKYGVTLLSRVRRVDDSVFSLTVEEVEMGVVLRLRERGSRPWALILDLEWEDEGIVERRRGC